MKGMNGRSRDVRMEAFVLLIHHCGAAARFNSEPRLFKLRCCRGGCLAASCRQCRRSRPKIHLYSWDINVEGGGVQGGRSVMVYNGIGNI